jgi:hydrogenase maturation protein HypF
LSICDCDPLDRRFHAQPNCCAKCGPKITLFNQKGEKIIEGIYAVEYAAKKITEGNIVAIKGLGGFHISCTPYNKEVIDRLRQLKNRPFKPFALMALDIQQVKKVAKLSLSEENLLKNRARPIVLLSKISNLLPDIIAPDTREIGIMLPYTPLHYLLLYFYKKYLNLSTPALLIMTSGNKSSQPICIGNRETINNLKDFVSYFLG